MATTEKKLPGIMDDEREVARKLAQRYRCPFVDLTEQRIDPDPMDAQQPVEDEGSRVGLHGRPG